MKHKIILGIDPGPEKSAYVYLCGKNILSAGYIQNDILIHKIMDSNYDICAVEGVRSFGKKIGNTTLITCELSGIFYQAAKSRGKISHILYRNTNNKDGIKSIRAYLCGKVGSKENEVDQVVKNYLPRCWSGDLISGERGPLFLKINGIYYNHKLSAAAVAITYQGSAEYQELIK